MRSETKSGIRSFAKTAWKAAAFSASTLALSGQGAFAQQVADAGPSTEAVTVHGVRQDVQSPKYTAPLVDTPQTITVVPREIIEQQQLLSLRDVLSTLPGITFGAGEGGGGFGDSINLRGFTASNDITVDGVRDSAQYTRSDPFDLEQVEVVSGANSVYAGAGSVGGSVNLVTKRPTMDNNTQASGAFGSSAYQRATVDMNRELGADGAFRLNAMAHRNHAPGRDVESFSRWGVAPAIAFGFTGPTRVTALFVHQQDNNTPQYGVPYALNAYNHGPLAGVNPRDYFGYPNIDKQDSTVDGATLILEHDFNAIVSLRNLTRWEEVSQTLVVDAPQGTFCLADGINPYTGAVCAPVNTFLPSGNPRGNERNTDNEALVNQTDLTFHLATGALKHTLVTGAAFSSETYHLDTGNVLRNPLGATPNPVLPTTTISNPNSLYTGPVNFIRTGFTDSEVRNRAIYAFDSIEIGDRWELNGGVRYEQNRGHANVATIAVPYPAPPASPVVTVGAPADNEDNLFSYRVGVVFKPAAHASLYAAYGNSATPSQSTVNGACTAISTTGAANCNVDPERAVSTEIGGKWDALGGRLSLTAAIFRNERINFRVASGDPTVPEQQLNGSSRVDGLALGASGLIARHWSVFANYTYLDSKILQNISDIAISGGVLDFQAGDPLPNTPKHSFSAWTTYQIRHGLAIGYGATYQGEYTFNRLSAASPLFYTPDYWVQRAMVNYEVSERLAFQLNVNNLSDKLYYTRIRNNATSGWATPGDARQVTLSMNARF